MGPLIVEKLLHIRCASVERLVLLLVILSCQKKVSCEPASCGSALNNDDDGSSFIDNSVVCGENSECFNDAVCQCQRGYFTPSGNHTDCRSPGDPDSRCEKYDEDCVFCGSMFMGPCQACTDVIYNDQCLGQCPENTIVEGSRDINTNLVINRCEGSDTSPLPDWAIIVISVLGAVGLITIAICIASVACCFLRRSSVGLLDIAERNEQSKAEKVDDSHTAAIGYGNNLKVKEGGGVMEDYFEAEVVKLSEEETKEFFSKLAVLRTQKEIFLKMINDMRRRLKELPQTSPAMQQYKDVIRDLSRLLFILNAKPEAVRIPPDGIQLLDWSEQILNRYLLAQGKPTIDINAGVSNAASNPNRISIIGDQATTHF